MKTATTQTSDCSASLHTTMARAIHKRHAQQQKRQQQQQQRQPLTPPHTPNTKSNSDNSSTLTTLSSATAAAATSQRRGVVIPSSTTVTLIRYASIFPRPYIKTATGTPPSPLLLRHALQIVARLMASNTPTTPLPTELCDPAAMLLVGIIAAESHLADAQTSSQTWASILGSSREHIARVRRLGLEALGFDTRVSSVLDAAVPTADEVRFCEAFLRVLVHSL